MRGLAEIRKVNENPSGFPGEEFFGGRHHDEAIRRENQRVDDLQSAVEQPPFMKFWSELNERRQRDGQPEALFKDAKAAFNSSVHYSDIEARALAHALASLVTHSGPRVSRQDQHALNALTVTGFLSFWADLNERRVSEGKSEALYNEAKTLFHGGPTPVGAMNFIGRQWDGLRAVPAEPVEYLGGKRPAYHGEFREVTAHGTVWHKVTNDDDRPIAYKLPEAAITAAEGRREGCVAKQFR